MAKKVCKDPVRETLQSNWTYILNNLELDKVLLGECFGKNLIGRDQLQRINAKETSTDKNDVFLDHAYTCWNEEYLLRFCRILEKHTATNPDRFKSIAENIYATFEEKTGQSLTTVSTRSPSNDSSVKSILPDAILDSKPELPHVLDVVPMMSSEWQNLGLRMHMRDYVLKNIGKNKREVVEECCLQMCREWLEEKKGTGKEERKWRTVLDCVERVYGVERRREIEEELKEKLNPSK